MLTLRVHNAVCVAAAGSNFASSFDNNASPTILRPTPTLLKHSNMHILLTGATGTIGSLTAQRLSEHGHTVVATDVRPWSAAPKSPALPKNVSFVIADLTSIPAVDGLFKDQKFDGVIHLGAYPWPRADLDDRELYANNSVSSYLVMRTAVNNGVKRIVQASSVNALGLSYSPEGHNLHKYDEFPLTEKSARRPVSRRRVRRGVIRGSWGQGVAPCSSLAVRCAPCRPASLQNVLALGTACCSRSVCADFGVGRRC